jgi:hypothetical protein
MSKLPARRRQIFLLVIAIFTSALAMSQQIGWESPYAGNDPTLLYYPDQNAVYFRYGWENKGQGLVIKGKMPHARYFSFNLYDDYTKGSIGARADYEILPDENDKSSYTIHIVPKEQAGKYRNQLIIPDSIRNLSVFLRYYLAEGDIYAGVPLPGIVVLNNDATTSIGPSIPVAPMKPEDLAGLKTLIKADPHIITSKERKLLASSTATIAEKQPIISKVLTVPVFKHNTDPNKISAFNFNSSGNYPNKDNHYLLLPVVRKKKDDVLIVRFKAPGYAKQLGDTSKDVRYYSLSQGDEYTHTSLTMHDEQLHVSADGFIYVVVASDSKEVKAKAQELGFNFMPWLYKDRLVLILRHMLPSPSFTKSAKQVPLFNNAQPAESQAAQNTIGAYALVGKLLNKKAWAAIQSSTNISF